MQQIYTYSNFKKREIDNLIEIGEIINHPNGKDISRRIKVIDFFNKYGARATREGFGVARSTVYLWKKVLRESGGKIKSLAPMSKAPKRRRERKENPVIEGFIIGYREKRWHAGKETIKPELDKYCEDKGIRMISVSTIGRIINDLKEKGVIESNKRVSFYGKTGKVVIRNGKKRKKERRKGYMPKEAGDLVQVDSVDIFEEGIKRYIINGIDVKTRFGFGICYERLNSKNAKDFMEKFREVCPFEIKRVQTDNGSEFEKYFDKYIEEEKLTHFYNYAHHPQSNGYIERFNRTVKEQYVYSNYDKIMDVGEFNRGMSEYLLWYNTEKIHRGIGNKPPLKYYLDNFIHMPKKSNMLWTLTIVCF